MRLCCGRSTIQSLPKVKAATSAWAGPEQTFKFECECGNVDGCHAHVVMTLAEYGAVVVSSTCSRCHLAIRLLEIEHIVEQSEHFPSSSTSATVPTTRRRDDSSSAGKPRSRRPSYP